MDWAFLRNVYENEGTIHKFMYKCRDIEKVKQGGVYTIDALRCTMECTGMSNGKSYTNECRYKIELRCDGKKPKGYIPVNYKEFTSFRLVS